MIRKTITELVQAEVNGLRLKDVYKAKLINSIIRTILFIALVLSVTWIPNWILFLYVPVATSIHSFDFLVFYKISKKCIK